MAFASAVIKSDKSDKFVIGSNGANKLKTSDSSFLDVFTNFNKDTSIEYIKNSINNMMNEILYISDKTDKEFAALNIFRLWVHKRHVRNGEKEKLLSYRYFLELYNIFPKTCCDIVEARLFGEIGYWKDGLLIWGLINDMDIPKKVKFYKYNPLIMSIRKSMLDQRSEDLKVLAQFIAPNNIRNMSVNDIRQLKLKSNTDVPSISRVGEWCVRESSPENKNLYWYVTDLENNLYIKSHVSYMISASLKEKVGNKTTEWPVNKSVPFGAKKSWRQLNSLLNEYMEITETRMTSNRWDLLIPSNIPSMCSYRNMKAFLNEKINTPPEDYQLDTGNRYPNNLMRVDLRSRTRDMFSDPSRMNVGGLFPHIIANQVAKAKSLATRESKLAAWDKKILDTKEKFEDTRKNIRNDISLISAAMASGNIVGCADVSASMTWVGKEPNRPYDIAIGLTCFISCIASNKFKDIAFSFSTNPYCLSFKNKDGQPMNVIERMNKIIYNSGGSTNYEGLHDAMINLCVANNVSEKELPVLWIGSDGEFDMMGGLNEYSNNSNNSNKILSSVEKWELMHESIEKKWMHAGYHKVPLIVYHNLNSLSNGVQVDHNYKGVILLAGRSETVLEYILYGESVLEDTKVVNVDGKDIEVTVNGITPYDIFAKAMDNDKYYSIESILRNSEEWKIKTNQ